MKTLLRSALALVFALLLCTLPSTGPITASDKFGSYADSVSAPSRVTPAITPSDTAIDPIPKALYIGTGGTVVLRGVDDTADRTFKNVANGTILPVRAQFVRASTTAADIVALD